MKALTLALLLSFGINGFAETLPLEVRVMARAKDRLVGVLPDWRVVFIVCNGKMFGGWKADLVFPDENGEVLLDGYRPGMERGLYVPTKPAYRPLLDKDADVICDSGAHVAYRFLIHEDRVELRGRPQSFRVEALPVERRAL